MLMMKKIYIYINKLQFVMLVGGCALLIYDLLWKLLRNLFWKQKDNDVH